MPHDFCAVPAPRENIDAGYTVRLNKIVSEEKTEEFYNNRRCFLYFKYDRGKFKSVTEMFIFKILSLLDIIVSAGAIMCA
jgi:hypothetical protein